MVPTFRKLAVLHAIKLFGEFRVLLAIFRYPREPRVTQLFPALADALTEMLVDAIGHVKFLIFRPAIVSLRESHLLFAEWFAVRPAGVLLVWRTVADMAVH